MHQVDGPCQLGHVVADGLNYYQSPHGVVAVDTNLGENL